jgi:hypothetical protein
MTDIDNAIRQAYAAAADALAWSFLYYKFAKIPPTTPLGEMFSAGELELIGADPATPVGDVLPREELVQACRDTCGRAAELIDSLYAKKTGLWNLPRKSEAENVVVRYFEILCDLISARAFIPGSAPRRSWNWEDFSGRKLETRSGNAISRFLKTPLGSDEICRLSW